MLAAAQNKTTKKLGSCRPVVTANPRSPSPLPAAFCAFAQMGSSAAKAQKIDQGQNPGQVVWDAQSLPPTCDCGVRHLWLLGYSGSGSRSEPGTGLDGCMPCLPARWRLCRP